MDVLCQFVWGKMIQGKIADGESGEGSSVSRVIATKNHPFEGLFRPFVIWVVTSVPMLLFGTRITEFAYSLLEGVANETIVSGVYWLTTTFWVGGFFYFQLLSYIIDAIFYQSKLPRDLVLRDGDSVTLMMPLLVTSKSWRKKFSKLHGSPRGQWLGAKKFDPWDIWDDEDLHEETTIAFDDIKEVWFNTHAKHPDQAQASGKNIPGALIIRTHDDKIYMQSKIRDLRTVTSTFSQQDQI